MLIHSYNQFHAAGHGTFFSGQIVFAAKDLSTQHSFVWAYDCGSKRSGRIPVLVRDLKTQVKVGRIDLFCVSHFDADHVNGLKALLTEFRIDTLALPYLPLHRRLEVACGLELDNEAAVDAMLFALDPAGFLSLRGLGERVKRIVLVQGGGEASAGPPAKPTATPPERGQPGDDDANGEQPGKLEVEMHDFVGDDQYAKSLFDEGHRNRPRTALINHSQVVMVPSLRWEFVFFNKDLPNGKATKSGKSLKEVQDEIQMILKKYDLASGGAKVAEGWRKELRKCYDRNFGADPVARNEISLCALSRPVSAGIAKRCSLFKTPNSHIGCAHSLIPAPTDENNGLLLTGDISLNLNQLKRLADHFGETRWQRIKVMQIPHHGSQHSWEERLARSCPQDYSVLCVPDTDPAGHHPHADVLSDLVDKNPVRADYSNSVVYCFHVNV